MTTYTSTIGTQPTLTATFKVNNVPTDPTTVTLRVRTPSGVVTDYHSPADITRVSAGVYEASPFTFDAEGVWYAKWVGTGSVGAASPDIVIKVQSSIFT